MISGPVGHGGLAGELQGLDAQQGALLVDRVVDERQVLQGRPLPHTSELVVHGAVANAHPARVGAQVWDGDAAQVGAHGRDHQDLGVSGGAEDDFLALVQHGFLGVAVFLVHLVLGESPDENGGSVPHDLDDLSGRQGGNIDFHVGVAVVAGPAVETADQGDDVETGEVEHAAEEHTGEGVDLRPPDIGLVLVVDSVLVEPVVDGGGEVNMVSEVARAGGGGEELSLLRHQVSAIQLNVGAPVVLADETKGAGESQVSNFGYCS